MFGATNFIQECPVCGRKVQIRAAYLGREVACQHCQGRFRAMDSALEVRHIDLAEVDEMTNEANELDESVFPRIGIAEDLTARLRPR